MKKELRVALRVSAPIGGIGEYFQRSLLNFINGWLWRYKTRFSYYRSSPIKLVKISNHRKSMDYVLSYTVGIEYTSQLFHIKDVRYYEKET